MSLPGPSDPGPGAVIPSIFSIFPAAKSPSSSTSSSNGQFPVPNFSPSISSFFPPNNSLSSSESAQVKQSSPSISSLFPPTHSQSNSLSSTRSIHELANSICSIFRPNHSSSSESTHDQFTSKRSKLDHELEDASSGIVPHFNKPNTTRWPSFKINTPHEERIFPQQACSSSSTPSRPIVLNDSQDFRRRILHQTLIACAEAVQLSNLSLAKSLVKQISSSAASQAGTMQKVTAYFTEALYFRIYGQTLEQSLFHIHQMHLQQHFYETCPYLKFAHFTANQAILEAFEGKKQVHVIDFSINQGMQWPALMQALALRPGGAPAFRLSGVGPPAPDGSDYLKEVGLKLAQFARTINVRFEYRGVPANSLADVKAWMLNLRPSEVEAVAVNSVFELHKLLARPGAIEKVLSMVKQMKPIIVTVVEQEANHNGPIFLDRFTQSLHYYSTMFDSLEGLVNNQDKVMSEMYLGQQICNVVACEGVDRVERHETLTQWITRLRSAGFAPVHLGSNAFKQASMMLDLFAGVGYRVEENNGSLMLGWHTRPLIATSACLPTTELGLL